MGDSQEREALRRVIVNHMHDKDMLRVEFDDYRDLYNKLGMSKLGVSLTKFKAAITGSHYKHDGKLHIGHKQQDSMSEQKRRVLTCSRDRL